MNQALIPISIIQKFPALLCFVFERPLLLKSTSSIYISIDQYQLPTLCINLNHFQSIFTQLNKDNVPSSTGFTFRPLKEYFYKKGTKDVNSSKNPFLQWHWHVWLTKVLFGSLRRPSLTFASCLYKSCNLGCRPWENAFGKTPTPPFPPRP